MPWETGWNRFAQSRCGPTARAIGVLAFAVAGIAIALGEVKGWIHNIMIVMIGIAIAILAPSVLGMLGTSVSFSCA
jgi:type IV secretory pathway VirB2 component (pilin)